MDREIHYLSYDPEEIWKEMIVAYVEAGGDILYPGDEKEMLLRGVQSIITQVFAGVDAALRMDTLRYAVGEYLNIYGEKRNCIRLPAQTATGTVEITFKASGTKKTIPAGTAITADGERIYLLSEDVSQTGYEQAVIAEIRCQESGSIGNGLVSGTRMQFLTPNPAVMSILATEAASGGQDEEDDDAYRERIRTYGLVQHTTGTKEQYESVAMSVSTEVLDALAANIGAGKVGVYILSKAADGALLDSVREALTKQDVRPLTDEVSVYESSAIPYVLNVQCAHDPNTNITQAAANAVAEYQHWQDQSIGMAFNPDRLMAMLYQAGATRVTWGEGSHFNGGEVAYTAIEYNAHCSGTINLSIV